jgi:multidrug efflux pump subunit AcrA (membrane-fusion protein)
LTIARTLTSLAVIAALAACGKPEPRTVQQFMDDEVALTGALARCESMGSESMRDVECQNARRASERLAAIDEERVRKAREEEFQRKRAALRDRQEQDRLAREAAEAEARAQREQALLGATTFDDEADSEGAGESAGVEEQAPVTDQADTDPALEVQPGETGAAPDAAPGALEQAESGPQPESEKDPS